MLTTPHGGTEARRLCFKRGRRPLLSLTALVALTSLAALVNAQAPAAPAAPTGPQLAAPTGSAQRGKVIFETTLRCFACHGYDGQTGSPRLVPMARAEDIFLAYVRKPATQGMPSFAAVPEQQLRDVYAYIRSIPQAAPAADSIPLIKAITDRRSKAN
jgi:mono/diheme cytochrome c family protein